LTYRLQHASGEYRTVQEQGKGVFDPSGLVVAIEGWIIDISDQKKVEEALLESETHYRNLIEISPDGVVLIDAEGKILFSNQQFALMVGEKATYH
jgi:PAS domain-containing protein